MVVIFLRIFCHHFCNCFFNMLVYEWFLTLACLSSLLALLFLVVFVNAILLMGEDTLL